MAEAVCIVTDMLSLERVQLLPLNTQDLYKLTQMCQYSEDLLLHCKKYCWLNLKKLSNLAALKILSSLK